MLYSEKELQKRLKSDCALYYFYSIDEALVDAAARKALQQLRAQDPEATTLPGPTPTVEDIVLAAGTVSFFGGRRLVVMPLIKPSAYSDKDLKEICDTLAQAENAVFVLTSVMAERYGSPDLGKREQKFIAACEKLGYCVQINRPDQRGLRTLLQDWAAQSGARFAQGADTALLDLCGSDQFLLHNEVEKLAALANYRTITEEMVRALCTATLEADTFEMVRLVTDGRTGQALDRLHTLLALQNKPILITGALIGNYLDLYRVLLGKNSRRSLTDVAKDFHYTGNWSRRLGRVERTALRYERRQLEHCLEVLYRLDKDLKSSPLEDDILLQKALCELTMAGAGHA